MLNYRIRGTLHEAQYTFLIIFGSVLLRMKNVSDKSCRVNENTFFCVKFFFLKNRAVYEIMWKNTVEPDRPQVTIWRMRIAFRIPKATNTHPKYVLRIAFALQQWLQERASMVRCTYIDCIVKLNFL